MILEPSKNQNNQDLAKFLGARKAAAEHSAAAAAKILELEQEVASLQEALTETTQDADAREEMMRLMRAHKDQGGESTKFPDTHRR